MELYLDSVVDYLRRNPVELSSRHADGRVNSTDNEDEVLSVLTGPYAEIIEVPEARSWYDFALRSSIGVAYVNIKVTNMGGAADNLSSKHGMGYALTGLTNLPDAWNKFNEKICENIRPGYDYYFLIVNKNDTSDVFWSSLKRIRTLVSNGNNLPFQCDWNSNREWTNRNERDAMKYILSVYLESWNKKISGYPTQIRELLERF